MGKNPSKQRPGVIARFDWISPLEKMSSEGKARFLMAILQRGKNPSFEVDLSGLEPLDAARLETLWELAAPVIDADGEGWSDAVLQRSYAGYCSACQRKGEDPMDFQEYASWYKIADKKGFIN